jgi:hypothetical protein
MANPRNVISHAGVFRQTEKYRIDASTITYDATAEHGSPHAGPSDGKAVRLSANDTVALATDGSFVLGKLILVESDGVCTVQVGGYCTLPKGTGATFILGVGVVGAVLSAAPGYVRGAASATAAELALQNGKVHDTAPTNDVWVKL